MAPDSGSGRFAWSAHTGISLVPRRRPVKRMSSRPADPYSSPSTRPAIGYPLRVSTQVRTMFAGIAKSYDRGNQILSLGLHHRWRAAAVRLSGAKPGDRVLDCATGTGDLALAFHRAVAPTGEVVATDFCAEMLDLARAKAERERRPVRFEAADVMRLPYAEGAFAVSAIAFGIRNVDDPGLSISEMARVVKPGGSVDSCFLHPLVPNRC